MKCCRYIMLKVTRRIGWLTSAGKENAIEGVGTLDVREVTRVGNLLVVATTAGFVLSATFGDIIGAVIGFVITTIWAPILR